VQWSISRFNKITQINSTVSHLLASNANAVCKMIDWKTEGLRKSRKGTVSAVNFAHSLFLFLSCHFGTHCNYLKMSIGMLHGHSHCTLQTVHTLPTTSHAMLEMGLSPSSLQHVICNVCSR